MTRTRTIAVLIAAFAFLVTPTQAATNDVSPYSLVVRALIGNDGTDISLTVSSATDPVPDQLQKVQLKALPFGDETLRTSNYFDLPAPAGVAILHVAGFARHQPLHFLVHVKEGNQNNLEAETVVLLRPDLTVVSLSVPTDVVRRQVFAVTATVAELAGDTGALATATLFDGTNQLASQPVSVVSGGTTNVLFAGVALGQAGAHALRVVVSGSEPAEANTANNEAAATVNVHMYTSDGVVSTDHWAATKIGDDILRRGGNAIDAAAAVEFALNVVDPNLTGIGGGSAVLVRLANGQEFAIDGRELAPHATTADEYKGQVAGRVGVNGYSVGVPATLRTVDVMLKRWGTMSLADVLAEPTALADDGAPVGAFLASGSAEARTLNLQPETIAMFRPGGVPLKIGDTIVQHDLAKTFRLIAADGVGVFYNGEIAQAIVDAQKRLSPTLPIVGGEGRMTLDDLAKLRVTVEAPLSLDYHGTQVLGPPPSTNGGLVLLETLGVYQKVQQEHPGLDYGWGTFPAMHAALESMRLAFADRDMWIGDDDLVSVPVAGLLSDGYLTDRSKLIGFDPGQRIATALPGNPLPFQTAPLTEDDSEPTGHTSHFSIIDKWGNAVSMTSTVADTFGSGIMVPGYGFELNDSLNLFNLTPKADPVAGNPGANDAAPDKRPMGSMSPAIVVKDGEPILVTGTYGSAFIPSLVFNVVTNVVDHGMTLQQAVDAPRMWGAVPNVARPSANFARNDGFPQATIDQMLAFGDQIAKKTTPGFGSTSSVGVDPATLDLVGVSDKRQIADPNATVVVRP
jgi:gamma-glutamyltranspeptidase/glutathione hydrolase